VILLDSNRFRDPLTGEDITMILQNPSRFQKVFLAILFNPLTDWAWDIILGQGRWAWGGQQEEQR
jgi:hypothetical protein